MRTLALGLGFFLVSEATAQVEVSGRLRTMDGKSVHGATIRVLEVKDFKIRGHLSLGLDAHPDCQTTRSDEAGSFRLDKLKPGRYRVQASAKDYGAMEVLDVEAPAKELDIVLPPGVALEGRVEGADGHPLEEARVEGWILQEDPGAQLEDLSSPPLATCSSDRDGKFQLFGLLPGGYCIRISAKGRLPVLETGCHLGTSIRSPKHYRLEEGKELRGIVKDAAGKPLPETKLIIKPVNGSGRSQYWGDIGPGLYATAVTDQTGSFTLEAVPDGDHCRVVVQCPGELPMEIPAPLGPEIRLPGSRGFSIHGSVLDAETRAPVPKAQVEVSTLYGSRIVSSGSDGTYQATVTGLGRRGKVKVTAVATGYAHEEREAAAAEDVELNITLGKGASLSGSVGDEEKRPLENVHVQIRRLNASSKPGSLVHETLSDSNGRFQIDHFLPRSRLLLRLEKKGFLAWTKEFLGPNPGQSTDLGDSTLRRGAVVQGAVTDTNAEPIPGCLVRIIGRAPKLSAGSALAETRSNTYGLYSFEGLHEGTVDLHFQASGYQDGRLEMKLEPGRVRHASTMTLKPAGSIHGIVYDPWGTPLPHARVAASQNHASDLRTDTDNYGAFTIEGLTSETVFLTVTYEQTGGYEERSVTVGDERLEFTLRWLSELRGTCVDEEGTPAAWFTVEPTLTNKDRSIGTTYPSHTFQKGEFVYNGLSAGTYRLRFTSPFGACLRENIHVADSRPTEVGEVRLGRGRRIQGRVVSSGNGKGLAGARVSIVGGKEVFLDPDAPRAMGTIVVSPDGAFVFEGINDAVVKLHVSHNDFVSRDVEVHTENTTAPCEIRLEPASTLSISVLDGHGKGLRGIEVLLFTGKKDDLVLRLRSVADGTGTARFRGVAPGSYTLQVRPLSADDDEVLLRKDIDIPSGGKAITETLTMEQHCTCTHCQEAAKSR